MSGSVLVVGGGIAGRALARALALRDVPCTLVEQRSPPEGLGAGLNLPGNAVRALAELGVAEQVVRRGVPVHRREYRNARGRLLFAVDDAAFWRGVGTPVCVRHGYLLQALAPPPPTVVLHGTRVVAVQPRSAGVEVAFESGDAELHDFVVGADGVHSATRSVIDRHGVRPSAMTRSSWRMIADDPGVDCWTVWSGPVATFLMIPVAPGRVYGYAASTRGAATGEDLQWLRRTFARFPEPVTAVVDAVLAGGSEVHHAPVEEVRLPRWHRERLVLVGDAAHATGPVWAQGAALALEDALVLARLLAGTHDWDRVGATFERERRPRVDHVQAATVTMSRLARLPGPVRDGTAPWFGPRAYRRAYEPLRAPC